MEAACQNLLRQEKIGLWRTVVSEADDDFRIVPTFLLERNQRIPAPLSEKISANMVKNIQKFGSDQELRQLAGFLLANGPSLEEIRENHLEHEQSLFIKEKLDKVAKMVAHPYMCTECVQGFNDHLM